MFNRVAQQESATSPNIRDIMSRSRKRTPVSTWCCCKSQKRGKQFCSRKSQTDTSSEWCWWALRNSRSSRFHPHSACGNTPILHIFAQIPLLSQFHGREVWREVSDSRNPFCIGISGHWREVSALFAFALLGARRRVSRSRQTETNKLSIH